MNERHARHERTRKAMADAQFVDLRDGLPDHRAVHWLFWICIAAAVVAGLAWGMKG